MSIQVSSIPGLTAEQAAAQMSAEGFAAAAKDYAPGRTEPHAHDYDVCLYILEGTFKLFDADRGVVHAFTPGDKVLVPSGTRHSEDHDVLRMVVGRRH